MIAKCQTIPEKVMSFQFVTQAIDRLFVTQIFADGSEKLVNANVKECKDVFSV